MKHSRSLPGAGLLASAAVTALALAACNRNANIPAEASYPNGAYVSGSNNTSLPVSATPAPPAGTYEAAARIAPPPIPEYDQPPMPAPGDVWTPGYWGWSDEDDDYYWVPGTWVEPPESGLYWTPGYWRYWDGQYLYSPGYWGPAVGFYGRVDYGWGYYGQGYAGGRWRDGRFWYNRRANNFGRWRVERAYDQPVRTTWNRAGYNGGPGGLRAAPSPVEVQASRARHAPQTRAQVEQIRFARTDPQLRARINRGAPPIAGASRPGAFHGPGVVVTGARSPASWTPGRPQARVQPGAPAPPGPGGEIHHAPTPGGPAPQHLQAAPHRAPFARGPTPAAPERAPPAARPPEARAPSAAPHAPPPEHPGPAFARREATPGLRAPGAPRPSAPAFRAAPARPELHAAPEIHRAPAFHPAPAPQPAPAFRAAPAPSFHAPPPAPHPTPAFRAGPAPTAPAPPPHAPPAPAVHPAPSPHPAAPGEPKHH